MTQSDSAQPFVSCIMPTYNRREFVSQAIHYFLRQDYPNKELIIIDDGTDIISDLVPDNQCIRYLHLDHRATIGAKRNIACQQAKGEIIVHWDDDDWYAPWRMSYQVKNLIQEQAGICGLDKLVFYDPKSEQSWQYIYPKGGRSWVAGGTLCYNKNFWRRNPFPDINVGEDGQFVWSNLSKKIEILRDCTFYVAIKHPGNTSTKQITNNLWHSYRTEEIRSMMGEDFKFYTNLLQNNQKDRRIQQSISDINIKEPHDGPLVSCIMPTSNRRLFVPQAIKYFLRQDYSKRELVIVDDGADNVEDLIPEDKKIKYIHYHQKVSLGCKRNIAVENSDGEIISHWDDDDWYHPSYLNKLIRRLLQFNNKQTISGLREFLIYLMGNSSLKICRTRGLAGASFCYYRDMWENNSYRDVHSAEDYFFLIDTNPKIVFVENPELFIIIRHKFNTWKQEKGINVNISFQHLRNYSKQFNEIIEKDDYRFYESAELMLTNSPTYKKNPQ